MDPDVEPAIRQIGTDEGARGLDFSGSQNEILPHSPPLGSEDHAPRAEYSNDIASRRTPSFPQSLASSTRTTSQLERRYDATPPPMPRQASSLDLKMSRNGHIDQSEFLSQKSSSSLKVGNFQGCLSRETPPPRSRPPSTGKSDRDSANQTPPPKRSLPGSFEENNVQNQRGSTTSVTSGLRQSIFKDSGPEKQRMETITLPDFAGMHSPDAQSARAIDILQLPLDERVLAVGFNTLVYKPRAGDDKGALVINLATLQRMRLHKLRAEIVKNALDIRYHGPSDPSCEAPLQEYVQAWLDWEYMRQCAEREDDPFTVKTSRILDAAIVREQLSAIRLTLTCEDSELLERYENDSSFLEPKDSDKPEILGGFRSNMIEKSKLKAFTERLIMAAVAWAFIIGPMLLMVLSNTKVTALSTTSVCVFAFGVLMARTLEKPFDVASATAAYAAVLMVFVGTNTAKSG